MSKRLRARTLYSVKHDIKQGINLKKSALMEKTPSYRLAFLDHDFLMKEELRPVRLQLELLKPEMIQQEQQIKATIVVFGSARIQERPVMERKIAALEEAIRLEPHNHTLGPQLKSLKSLLAKAHYYDEARHLGRLFSEATIGEVNLHLVIVTGGGPGIMEAANRGAHDVDAKSIGLTVVLPSEEFPNRYISPELMFQFHYFALRKMHFLMRARAMVVFPGGFGTLDELFETLTLIQQRKIQRIPLVLIGKSFWEKLINFEMMVEEGLISSQDLHLFKFAETAKEAYEHVVAFYETNHDDEHYAEHH